MSNDKWYCKMKLLNTLILSFAFLGAACHAGEPSPEPAASVVADQEISIQSLHGAYKDAGSQAPVVLIVPGSGPINRDGNLPGMASAVYKHLAETLAEHGVSTVRIDKRGMYTSHVAGDPNQVTLERYAKDYGLWIDHIIDEIGKDCIYLLGHSEGALMVSQAAIGRSDVCGIILAAGPGRSMGDLLREQIKANPANKPIKKKAFSAITALESGKKVEVSSMHPALQGLFAPAVQNYLISVIAVDPVKVLAQAQAKTLILQGDNDLQVSLQDGKNLAKVPNTTLVLLKDINHVLKPASRSRMRNLAVYNMPDRPVDPGVIEAIVNFVK